MDSIDSKHVDFITKVAVQAIRFYKLLDPECNGPLPDEVTHSYAILTEYAEKHGILPGTLFRIVDEVAQNLSPRNTAGVNCIISSICPTK